MPEHRGFEYEVNREAVPEDRGRYEYRFSVYVEGERLMTTTELEESGADGTEEDGGMNWTSQLRLVAIGYIEGLASDLD